MASSAIAPGGNSRDVVTEFCDLVERRSQQHRQALDALKGANLPGMVVGVLRQELDSMVRVMYILECSNCGYRDRLMRASLEGRRWPNEGGRGVVSDKEMVALAGRLHGWAGSVYKFGCGFIHLSRLHDYMARDPFLALTSRERGDLLRHLREYHGGPAGDVVTFTDIAGYLPRVFEKIAGNLRCYLASLRRGESRAL